MSSFAVPNEDRHIASFPYTPCCLIEEIHDPIYFLLLLLSVSKTRKYDLIILIVIKFFLNRSAVLVIK
jgi:hypothetical protein